MNRVWPYLRASTALVLAASMACPPARALVTLNDGHDKIYVTLSAGVSHDSNVFAQNGGKGDYLYTSGFSADYQRRAGWIGVNATMGISGAHYGSFSNQDYSDPSFSLELSKQTGRTTGAITISAARESRADAAVNTRNTYWNFSYGGNFHYHIVGTWDLSGGASYSDREYQDEIAFANLKTIATNVDLIKVVSAERDVMLGYRYRYSETSRLTSSDDHNFSVGVHGKVIPGINGSIRFGYQFRSPHGHKAGATTSNPNKDFQSWSSSGSVSYAINKKINLAGSLSKDFSTTATDSAVDNLVASLDAQYAFTSRIAFTSSIGTGTTKFLDNAGPARHDTYLTGSFGASYGFSEHLKFNLSYLWFRNWSSLNFADFVRSSWSLGASSHW